MLVLPIGLAEFPFLRLPLIISGVRRQGSPLNTIDSLLDLLLVAQQVRFCHRILNTRQYTINSTDVVRILLVIAPAGRSISFGLELPLTSGRAITLNNPTIEALIERLHAVPFGGCDVEFRKGAIIIVVVLNEELDWSRKRIVVRNITILAVFRVDQRKIAQSQFEVNSVLMRGLPFQDILVRAELIACVFAGENETIVAMLQLGKDVIEDVLEVIRLVHLFLLEPERLQVCDIERGVLFEPLGVGLQNVFLHTTESLIHALGCDVIAVYR